MRAGKDAVVTYVASPSGEVEEMSVVRWNMTTGFDGTQVLHMRDDEEVWHTVYWEYVLEVREGIRACCVLCGTVATRAGWRGESPLCETHSRDEDRPLGDSEMWVTA